MKNLMVALVGLFLSTFAFAKNPVTLTLKEGSANKDVNCILDLLDASMVTATINNDSTDAKYYAVWMTCHKGDETIRELLGYYGINPDSASTSITITAMAKDSLDVLICLGPNRKTVNIPTDAHALVGCDYNWTFNETDTIPLMAYTTGIPQQIKRGDKIFNGYYICGLRYSKLHPSKWKEKYNNLPDFIYFEAIPLKELGF